MLALHPLSLDLVYAVRLLLGCIRPRLDLDRAVDAVVKSFTESVRLDTLDRFLRCLSAGEPFSPPPPNTIRYAPDEPVVAQLVFIMQLHDPVVLCPKVVLPALRAVGRPLSLEDIQAVVERVRDVNEIGSQEVPELDDLVTLALHRPSLEDDINAILGRMHAVSLL
jgi:hypothetical protein